jgi:tRNA-specific 2-thiouridylase
MKKTKVMVGMSGGVDSSVAAALLLDQGYAVSGITMSLTTQPAEPAQQSCFSNATIRDAQLVCQHLGIDHIVLDYAQILASLVIEPFAASYAAGRTPNPCVLCNRQLKFGHLLNKALELGFDAFATGHYARIEQQDSEYILSRPSDKNKDQTYFLHAIPPTALPHIRFPLADYTKPQIRQIAHEKGLPVASKPGSQDICFIPDGDYRSFIQSRIAPPKSGPFVNTQGTPLGTHSGVCNYTIGQRKGLGVTAPNPLYVIDINPATNTIVLGEKHELFSQQLWATDVNILVPKLPQRAMAQIRYRTTPKSCSVALSETGVLQVHFDEPQESVTPGQSVVLYEGERVVGGGVIQGTTGAV